MNIVQAKKQYYFGALVILACCWILFSLDRETHSFFDLLKPGNLFVLLLYYTPTYAICYSLFRLFEFKDSKNSLLWSLLLGIPIGLCAMTFFFMWWMGRM